MYHLCPSNTKSQFKWDREKPLHSRKTAVNRQKLLEKIERTQNMPQSNDKASCVLLKPLMYSQIIFSVLSEMIITSSIYSLHYNKQPTLSVETNGHKSINSKHYSIMKPMHAVNRSNYCRVTGNSTLQIFN